MCRNYVDDKVIIITGAASGFGKIISQKTAAMGAKVICADINKQGLKDVAQSIKDAGGECEYIVADVSNKQDTDAMAKLAIDRFGRIDVLINNAGTMPLAFFEDHKIALKAWEKCIDINLKGTLYGICAVYDQMIAQGEGHIINVSSIYANFPFPGSAVYQATKVGVEYLATSLRQECQGKIKVSCIKPTGVPSTGLTHTEINPDAGCTMLGGKLSEYIDMAEEKPNRPELQNINSIKYMDCDPETVADSIVYLINQPMGIDISDITVRSSNERYLL